MAFPEAMLKPRIFESKTLCAESPLHPELSQGHVAKKSRGEKQCGPEPKTRQASSPNMNFPTHRPCWLLPVTC